jgi:hypothetical protein
MNDPRTQGKGAGAIPSVATISVSSFPSRTVTRYNIHRTIRSDPCTRAGLEMPVRFRGCRIFLEKAETIFHAKHYVNEYVPAENFAPAPIS